MPTSIQPYQITIAYADTDAGGVVYHGRYLDIAERARLDALQQLDYPITKMLQDDGGCFVVKHAAIDYRTPARLEDSIAIDTSITAISNSSVTFHQKFICKEKTLAVLEILLVFISTANGRPIKIPPALAVPLSALST